MKKKIFIKFEKCVGCKSCELACAVAHSSTKDLKTAILLEEKPGYRIKVETYKDHPIPVHCNHCEDATCILACPTGAVHRDGENKPVIIDSDRCIGCSMCVQACPFGMIDISVDGKSALKCDLCIERLAENKEPACVTACFTKALLYIDDKEHNQAKRSKTAEKIVKSQNDQNS